MLIQVTYKVYVFPTPEDICYEDQVGQMSAHVATVAPACRGHVHVKLRVARLHPSIFDLRSLILLNAACR